MMRPVRRARHRGAPAPQRDAGADGRHHHHGEGGSPRQAAGVTRRHCIELEVELTSGSVWTSHQGKIVRVKFYSRGDRPGRRDANDRGGAVLKWLAPADPLAPAHAIYAVGPHIVDSRTAVEPVEPAVDTVQPIVARPAG